MLSSLREYAGSSGRMLVVPAHSISTPHVHAGMYITTPLSSVTVSHLVIVAVPTPDGATLLMVTVPLALAVQWAASFSVTVPSTVSPSTMDRPGATLLNVATTVPSTVTSSLDLPLS